MQTIDSALVCLSYECSEVASNFEQNGTRLMPGEWIGTNRSSGVSAVTESVKLAYVVRTLT